MKKVNLNFVLKWTACVVTMVGAILTALQIGPMNIYVMNAGAAIYLAWSWRIREWNLIIINTALLFIYGVGVVLDFIS